MSNNLTKIHFSDLFKLATKLAPNEYELQEEKLDFYIALCNLTACIWNICSSSKNPEESENTIIPYLGSKYITSVEELVLYIIKMKFKNYRYDKNLFLYVKIEEQDSEYKVYSYLVDEKEHECPEAQAIYDAISSADFQAQLTGLLAHEKIK
jgi:hypothetical protein